LDLGIYLVCTTFSQLTYTIAAAHTAGRLTTL